MTCASAEKIGNWEVFFPCSSAIFLYGQCKCYSLFTVTPVICQKETKEVGSFHKSVHHAAQFESLLGLSVKKDYDLWIKSGTEPCKKIDLYLFTFSKVWRGLEQNPCKSQKKRR